MPRRGSQEEPKANEPLYVISIAAKMLGMHEQTLRYYERVGIIRPARSKGRVRLYSQADIERLRQVQRLMDELGVNLAGAEAILRLRQHIQQLEKELEEVRRELQAYRDRLLPAPSQIRSKTGDAP